MIKEDDKCKKMLNNLCYNIKKKLFDFFERITLNIGNSFSVYNKKHSWVIVNKRMIKSENDIVQSISNLNGLKNVPQGLDTSSGFDKESNRIPHQ